VLVRRNAAVFLIIAAMVASYAVPVSAQGDQTKAKMFLQIAEKAREIAIEFVEKARTEGKDVALATSLIEDGNYILNEAKKVYSEGNYDVAAAMAKLAQGIFRDSLETLGPERPSTEENEVRLREAIERTRRRILRIREALSNWTDIGQDLREQINSKVNQAEGLLNEAELMLRSNGKDASEAARRLAQSEKTIAEAFSLMKLASKELNKYHMEIFLKGFEREILRLRNELEKLEKKGVKVDDLQDLLKEAEELVGGAREKASRDDLSGALVDARIAGQIIEHVWKELVKRGRP
jgi:uncharacterized protein YaiI (UPF0178 family)